MRPMIARHWVRQFLAPVFCVQWMCYWRKRYGDDWAACLRVAHAMAVAFAMRDELDERENDE